MLRLFMFLFVLIIKAVNVAAAEPPIISVVTQFDIYTINGKTARQVVRALIDEGLHIEALKKEKQLYLNKCLRKFGGVDFGGI